MMAARVTLEAKRWHQVGDHPAVSVYNYAVSGASPLGLTTCARCGGDMHLKMGRMVLHTHGWLASSDAVVCPGDWVLTDAGGAHFACTPAVFEAEFRRDACA
jgi:hypothetical protein